MEGLISNALILFSALILFWALAALYVAYSAASKGQLAHKQNMRISGYGLRPALSGQLKGEVSIGEPRRNEGIAIELRSKEFIPQAKLSDDSVDEVLGVKI